MRAWAVGLEWAGWGTGIGAGGWGPGGGLRVGCETRIPGSAPSPNN